MCLYPKLFVLYLRKHIFLVHFNKEEIIVNIKKLLITVFLEINYLFLLENIISRNFMSLCYVQSKILKLAYARDKEKLHYFYSNSHESF